MSLGELARPITIYWDLSPSPPLPLDYARICEQVAAIKPLQLHLLDDGTALSAIFPILEHFRNSPLAVTLTTKTAVLAPDCIDNLKNAGLRELQLLVNSYAELSGVSALKELLKGNFATNIAFEVTNQNWRELPLVLSYCLEQGFASLTLPMQRLYGNETPFMPTSGEVTELVKILAGIGRSGLRLTIHDPFLWRAFYPSLPFPGGGCQAGNTMLAIAPDGMVYPCPALPLALGDLAETTLMELVAGEEKKRFRAEVATLPDGCRDCPEQAGCRGGCRGRSLVIGGNISNPDPACEIVIH